MTVLATLATLSGLLVAAPTALAKPTPPPNPSAGQISAAQARKNSLASEVGRLSGQIAQAQSALAVLQGKAELAEQNLAFALSKRRAADQAEQRAMQQVQSASRTVQTAHTKFVQYLQASYMSGSSDTSTGTLLTAKDPSTLLQASTLERYEAENKVDAIGTLQTATVAKSNADAAARRATQKAKQAAAKAVSERAAADAAVSAQTTQEAILNQTLSTSQTQLTSAQSTLATLNGQHAQYVAYQAHQAYLREQRRKRELAEQRAARLAHQQYLQRLARQRARRAHHQSSSSSSGGSSNGGGGGSSYSPPPSSNGGWTAAKGRYAVQRAMDEIGVPYAWAGGGPSGPSYGVCDSSAGAPNDCHVDGFDCSGLAMYAWGPYLSMDHLARAQYSEAGSMHPSISNLRPGDLLFYSFNGGVSGIHHVAIYAGGGQIVQAPYSGAYVEVSSMYGPGAIFGATRPLT